jgi:hypothetical protein
MSDHCNKQGSAELKILAEIDFPYMWIIGEFLAGAEPEDRTVQ